MPPRYAYWTILIDSKPTAFRARDREDLLPTFGQLRRANPQIEMKWFARGRLWDSPEQAQWAGKNVTGAGVKRDRDWRPGGAHADPRARFDGSARKKKAASAARARTAAGGFRASTGGSGAPKANRYPRRPASRPKGR